MQNIPLEELDLNRLLIPCIADDAFIDEKSLSEKISGKNFNEIYKSVLDSDNKEEKEGLKKEIYEKTLQRKLLLKIYFNKYKIKENILALKNNEQSVERINMDKFLAKIEIFGNENNKKMEKRKLELKEEFQKAKIYKEIKKKKFC